MLVTFASTPLLLIIPRAARTPRKGAMYLFKLSL